MKSWQFLTMMLQRRVHREGGGKNALYHCHWRMYICIYVVFSIPFLLDQEVILLRHSLLMDQVPVFLPMEPRLAPYGRPL